MFPPLFRPTSRRTRLATSVMAPRKSTRLILDVSVSLTGILVCMSVKTVCCPRLALTHINHVTADNARNDDEGYLNVECISPVQIFVDQTCSIVSFDPWRVLVSVSTNLRRHHLHVMSALEIRKSLFASSYLDPFPAHKSGCQYPVKHHAS